MLSKTRIDVYQKSGNNRQVLGPFFKQRLRSGSVLGVLDDEKAGLPHVAHLIALPPPLLNKASCMLSV